MDQHTPHHSPALSPYPTRRRVFLFARHAERQDFVTPWTPGCGWAEADPPISERGVRQANELAAYLATLDVAIDRIICSPYLRTMQTAFVVASTLKRKALRSSPEADGRNSKQMKHFPRICVEPGMCDWHRDWSNKVPRIDPVAFVSSSSHDDLSVLDTTYQPEYDCDHFKAMVHEPFPDFVKRIQKVLARVVRLPCVPAYAHREGKCCSLFMGHAATSIVCVRTVLNNPEVPVRAPVCSLSVLEERVDIPDIGLSSRRVSEVGCVKVTESTEKEKDAEKDKEGTSREKTESRSRESNADQQPQPAGVMEGSGFITFLCSTKGPEPTPRRSYVSMSRASRPPVPPSLSIPSSADRPFTAPSSLHERSLSSASSSTSVAPVSTSSSSSSQNSANVTPRTNMSNINIIADPAHESAQPCSSPPLPTGSDSQPKQQPSANPKPEVPAQTPNTNPSPNPKPISLSVDTSASMSYAVTSNIPPPHPTTITSASSSSTSLTSSTSSTSSISASSSSSSIVPVRTESLLLPPLLTLPSLSIRVCASPSPSSSPLSYPSPHSGCASPYFLPTSPHAPSYHKALRRSSFTPPQDGCVWHLLANGDVSFLSEGERHMWILPGEEELYRNAVFLPASANRIRIVRKVSRGEK